MRPRPCTMPTLITIWTMLTMTATVLTAAPSPKVLQEQIGSQQLPELVSKDFGTIPEGQVVVLELAITNQGTAPLRIGAVKPLCGCMTADAVKEIAPGKQGTISFRLETVGYDGETREAGLIQWIDTPVPVTRIEMQLQVEPKLTVKPGRIVRFRTTEGSPATQQVTISSSDGSPFNLTKVATSASFLSTAISGEKNSWVVTITLAGEAPAGMLREVITVETDLEQVPTLEIKVAGLVKGNG